MGIITERSDYKTWIVLSNKFRKMKRKTEGVPVTDTANFIGEVHYKIGTRLYMEYAD
jgi:hypothetical protein